MLQISELLRLFAGKPLSYSIIILLLAGIIGICAGARALYRVGVPRLPLLVFLGTLLSAYSHALPYGPLGSACFLIAVVWIERVWRVSQRTQQKAGVVAAIAMEAVANNK